MSLPSFRGTRCALRTLPRWTAATRSVAAAAARNPSAARRAQSSVSLDGQQSVRHISATTTASSDNSGDHAIVGRQDTDAAMKLLAAHLQKADPAVYDIIEKEKKRQKHFVNLIPSENFTSQAVLDALGSPMQNKYSEGYPGARYYGGNEFIDQAERLCQQRALEAFGLDEKEWGVNVQSLSGAPANLYVYSALMNTHDRLMGLDLPHGGHLSHGYQTPTKKISAISKYFETLPYRLNEETGLIDYEKLDEMAQLYRPKIIVAGASAYSRFIDYKKMKDTCEKVDAYLLADMAHISGMVAAKVVPSPFTFADIVTTTSHKSLRGPRGAMIFYRKGVRKVNKKKQEVMYDLEGPINSSVFPGHQGGPHNHTITALAVALKQATTPEFRSYQEQVLVNAQALANRLGESKSNGGLGYKIVSGGTDNHLVLVDLKPQQIDGARVERVLELVGVASNKNTVPGDKSALMPGGLRMGTPAMTTRGFNGDDFVRVADIVDRAVTIASRVDKAARKAVEEKGEKYKLRSFFDFLGTGEDDSEIVQLRSEVADWVGTYALPWDESP
ncbi:serine hydroxymethyltransferase mitochondrial [Apiospora saccharicola]|uniref:Serine hydroxymethyltransferase n=1 Tax=Apiospora saccharicola TaxID=335842 RepID=A0ABR1UFD6_9PEZI